MNTKKNTIELADISINVIHKDIKNVHLSVHPPSGRVTISAPLRMNLETIRLFSISKLNWIRKNQAKLKNQKRETPREYVTRESHHYLGKRYLLKIIEHNTKPKVVLKHNTIELFIRPGATREQKRELMQKWYKEQLREIIAPYISKLEKRMNVKVSDMLIRNMKTKWGTCKPEVKKISLNTELAKKSIENIEYVVIHEMVHLLERNHNDNFISHMDNFSSKWKDIREDLNRSALGHVEWTY